MTLLFIKDHGVPIHEHRTLSILEEDGDDIPTLDEAHNKELVEESKKHPSITIPNIQGIKFVQKILLFRSDSFINRAIVYGAILDSDPDNIIFYKTKLCSNRRAVCQMIVPGVERIVSHITNVPINLINRMYAIIKPLMKEHYILDTGETGSYEDLVRQYWERGVNNVNLALVDEGYSLQGISNLLSRQDTSNSDMFQFQDMILESYLCPTMTYVTYQDVYSGKPYPYSKLRGNLNYIESIYHNTVPPVIDVGKTKVISGGKLSSWIYNDLTTRLVDGFEISSTGLHLPGGINKVITIAGRESARDTNLDISRYYHSLCEQIQHIWNERDPYPVDIMENSGLSRAQIKVILTPDDDLFIHIKEESRNIDVTHHYNLMAYSLVSPSLCLA